MFCAAPDDPTTGRIVPYGMPVGETGEVRLIGWAARKQKGRGYSLWGCWDGVIHLVARSVADEEAAEHTIRSWAEGKLAQVARSGIPSLNGASWRLSMIRGGTTASPPTPSPPADDFPY